MSVASTTQTFTSSTTERSFCFIEKSVATSLLYGTLAAVLVLIIVIIVRECTHRRNCRSAPKSKIDSTEPPLPPDRYSDIESQTLNQRDHVQSVVSEDIPHFSTDQTDTEEPPYEEPAQLWEASRTVTNAIDTNLTATTAKVAKVPGKFGAPWKHPEIQKVVKLKPVVAKKKKKIEKIKTEEDRLTYVEADRGRVLVIREDEPDNEGGPSEFYVNAEPAGARRERRGMMVPESEKGGDEMYVNASTMSKRKW